MPAHRFIDKLFEEIGLDDTPLAPDDDIYSEDTTPENEEAILTVADETPEEKARVESLVHANMGLAKKLARQFDNIQEYGVDLEDINQVAMLALTKAARSYDESRGAAFSTYAYQIIKNSLISFRRQQAREYNLTVLDKSGSYGDGEEDTDGDTDKLNIPDKSRQSDVQGQIDVNERKLLVRGLIDEYIRDEDMKKCLILYFFKDYSAEEIGSALGFSKQYASRRISQGLEILRKWFRNLGYHISEALEKDSPIKSDEELRAEFQKLLMAVKDMDAEDAIS